MCPGIIEPLLAGAAAGSIGGMLGGLLGGGKKGSSVSNQNTTYYPYAFYQPTTSNQVQYPSYQFIIDSPLSSQDMTKKQSTVQQPAMSAPITAAPTGVSSPETAGSSLMPFMIVGGIVLLGYGLISKPSTRRRR